LHSRLLGAAVAELSALGRILRMDTSEKRLSLARCFAGFFILIGSLTAFAGLVWTFRTALFVARAAKATGTVIEMERSMSSEGGSTFHPVFTFADSSGIIHTQRVLLGSSTYTFEPGEKITVLYDRDIPKHSNIDSFKTVWLAPVFITTFGLLSGGFASFWLYIATQAIRLEHEKRAA
jgi:hypothetical protein